MRTAIVTAILLLVGMGISRAQNQPDPLGRSLQFKLLPLGLIDPYKPAIRASTEWRVSEKKAWELELGASPFERKGYQVRAELKEYHQQLAYYSVGVFYHKYDFVEQPSFLETNPLGPPEPFDVGVVRQQAGVDLRTGFQRRLGFNTFIEVYAGAGAMLQIREHDGPDEYQIGESFFARDVSEGLKVLPKFSLGVKVGFTSALKGKHD